MTTKGYHRYRGRNTRGKVALVVVLVLILLAAVAYLLTQEYVVYDDEGKAHLEMPWSRKEPKKPQPDSTPVPDDVDITREEPQRQKVEAIHAWELPYGCLGSDPGYLLTDREAVAVNVKMYDGSVAYHTAVSLPEGILTGGNATSRNLQTILDSDCYTVARLACFCDNAYADAMGDRAALCTAEGVLYRDGSGRRPSGKDSRVLRRRIRPRPALCGKARGADRSRSHRVAHQAGIPHLYAGVPAGVPVPGRAGRTIVYPSAEHTAHGHPGRGGGHRRRADRHLPYCQPGRLAAHWPHAAQTV